MIIDILDNPAQPAYPIREDTSFKAYQVCSPKRND